MKRTFLLLTIITLVGCSGGNSPDWDTAKATAQNIMYSKDARSGLCFGSVISRTYYGFKVVSIAHVPCEKVEHLLVK